MLQHLSSGPVGDGSRLGLMPPANVNKQRVHATIGSAAEARSKFSSTAHPSARTWLAAEFAVTGASQARLEATSSLATADGSVASAVPRGAVAAAVAAGMGPQVSAGRRVALVRGSPRRG